MLLGCCCEDAAVAVDCCAEECYPNLGMIIKMILKMYLFKKNVIAEKIF